MTDSVTTDRVDYILRCGAPPPEPMPPFTIGAPGTRRLVRIQGIGRPEKTRSPGEIGAKRLEPWRPLTAELITGLYGYRIPFAFSLRGSPDGVHVALGTWSASSTPNDPLQDSRMGVIGSVLRGLYPAIDITSVQESPHQWECGGMALGIPAPSGVDDSDGALPIDRIVRSMTGCQWAVLVLAQPASEKMIAAQRDSILNEMRVVSEAAKNEAAPSPLTDQYIALLKSALDAVGEGMATGAWRTGIYLLGDRTSYPRLASVWRSVMSGVKSLPEPVRVVESDRIAELAYNWALPEAPGASAPGYFHRPFECQTLLTTTQLAAGVHLPELETRGYRVNYAPRFDVVPPDIHSTAHLTVGRILDNGQQTDWQYRVAPRSLNRHTFVAGTTGSGKTNTIMTLLTHAAQHSLPFMVLEPAKTEYRALIEHSALGRHVRVFTPGRVTVAPFVLNPFEVPHGTPVSVHLDLLRAVFTAAFGMWTPLPQILERCLHEIYADRGWDLRTSDNARLSDAKCGREEAFPTITDLIHKVDQVISDLGYEEKIAGDMRAALLTRLQSLRQGAKGAMLDVTRSIPASELFDTPVVVELEALGDEGDKAFLLGLLLIRLVEHRRAAGQADDLVHLLVIEEAHRLLANVPQQASEEAANPRGEAVETFSNLLSEIRAYGQGVVIADQVPARLAPDVIKNTNLKIGHRIVSADDRAILAGSMAMNDMQSRALTTLGAGEAIVFSSGDDAPIHVQVPLVKDALADPPPEDRLRQHMNQWRDEGNWHALFWPNPFCLTTCASPSICQAAKKLVDDDYVQRALSRLVTSIMDEPAAIDRLWSDFLSVLKARRSPDVPHEQLIRSFAGHGSQWLASRRGAQSTWSFDDTVEFRDRLCAVLLAQLDDSAVGPAVESFRYLADRLHVRTFEPYPACLVVCTQDPPLCRYRSAVADLVLSRRYHESWREADKADSGSEDKRRRSTWEVCQDAAYELVEFPTDEKPDGVRPTLDTAARRVCLCFAQQMIAEDAARGPRTARQILGRVLAESGL